MMSPRCALGMTRYLYVVCAERRVRLSFTTHVPISAHPARSAMFTGNYLTKEELSRTSERESDSRVSSVLIISTPLEAMFSC